jgi:hypothetical protein
MHNSQTSTELAIQLKKTNKVDKEDQQKTKSNLSSELAVGQRDAVVLIASGAKIRGLSGLWFIHQQLSVIFSWSSHPPRQTAAATRERAACIIIAAAAFFACVAGTSRNLWPSQREQTLNQSSQKSATPKSARLQHLLHFSPKKMIAPPNPQFPKYSGAKNYGCAQHKLSPVHITTCPQKT